MFRGEILGVIYYTWNAYKKAWNKAVREGKLVDRKGRKVTKMYPEEGYDDSLLNDSGVIKIQGRYRSKIPC